MDIDCLNIDCLGSDLITVMAKIARGPELKIAKWAAARMTSWSYARCESCEGCPNGSADPVFIDMGIKIASGRVHSRRPIWLLCLLGCLAHETRADDLDAYVGSCQLDYMAGRGESMSNATPLSAELRSRISSPAARRGFDIGVGGVGGSYSQNNPFIKRLHDALNPVEQTGFDIAIAFFRDQTVNRDLASWGAAVARLTPILAEARIADPDLRYTLGFDIATGIFGDRALGAMGRVARGPAGSGPSSLDAQAIVIRNSLGLNARQGFDAATNLYWSGTRISPDGRPLSVQLALNPTPNYDDLAAKGQAIENADPLTAELASRLTSPASRRGFDLGVGAADKNTAPGPGKQRIHDSLNSVEQTGYDIAVSFALDRNRNTDLATRGAAVSGADAILAEARTADPDLRYRLGFDIATGIFADPARGGLGHFTGGPASRFPVGAGGSSMDTLATQVRNWLGPIARNGFDAAVNLYWSGTKFGPDRRPVSVTLSLDRPAGYDEVEAKGMAIANADPLSAELRNRQRDSAGRRGFDIGMATTEGLVKQAVGTRAIHDALCYDEQDGFDEAVSFSLQRNGNAKLAAIGAAIAAQDAVVAQARTTDADPFYWLGFDIATGIFGDPALGAQGNTVATPASLYIRDTLSANTQRGFNSSMALHLGRNYKIKASRRVVPPSRSILERSRIPKL